MATFGQPELDLVIDINQYLIDEFPLLSLIDRKAIGTLILRDDEFDLTSVHDQINQATLNYINKENVNNGSNEE